MTVQRTPMSWSARLLIGVVLLLAGAAAMTWSLARYPSVAQTLGVSTLKAAPQPAISATPRAAAEPIRHGSQSDLRVAALEARLARVESEAQHAAGSAGRADALLIAFAARRAIDRGVALGYLENLLVQRFGAQHQAAVSTVITASRHPIRLEELQTQFDALGPVLRRGGPEESLWAGIGRELGSLIELRRADTPPVDLDARYRRVQQQLALGRVEVALAETMRMPGASGARDWIGKARRYAATQNALDELESAALLGDGRAG